MKKIIIFWISIAMVLILQSVAIPAPKDLEIQGKKLVSQKPPFTFILPSELRSIHSFSQEHPDENSITRAYFFIKEKNRYVEEMLIVQIADKINPQAGPMTAHQLKPYTEKRMYSKSKIKKAELEVDYLIQLMAWNPEALSLQAIISKGVTIPRHLALQGQFLFFFLGEHAVYIRYSKDVNASEVKVSEEGDRWNKDSISGNEKKVYETFKKNFMEMMDSIQIKNP
jgi:hypothetical protein